MHRIFAIPTGKDFIRAMYAHKGDDKPKKAKVAATPSAYAGVGSSSFQTDFGSGASSLAPDPSDPAKKTYQTSATLSPELGSVANQATSGLGANLAFLQQDPQQRVQSLIGGEIPLYNVMKEQSDRQLAESIGRQQVNAQLGGLTNSTTLGSALGRIANDDILRQNQLLLQGLDYGNQSARADAQFGLNTITGLNSLITPLGSAAAAQLQTALGSQDQAAAATAAAQNQANLQYANALNQYNQQQSASLGNMIGGGIGTALSLGLAPFTGGGSLLGNAISGGFGGLFGGAPALASSGITSGITSNFLNGAPQAALGGFGGFGSGFSPLSMAMN